MEFPQFGGMQVPGFGGGMFGAEYPLKKKKKKQGGFNPLMMLSPMAGMMMSNPQMGLMGLSPGIGIANMLGAFK